jgi:anti-sigma factor RsiW
MGSADVNCAQTQNLLHAFLDGELDVVRQLEVEHHLADCSACAALHEGQRSLGRALANADLYFRAPSGLRERLQESLAAQRKPRRFRVSGRRLAALAAGILVLVGALAFAARGTLWPAANDDRLTREIVACHVRSLQAEHLTDVASSDKHKIKPWFKGQLDFAPPVCDLQDQNFVLVGGRLDYLDNRPVAALVYRRREHVINVFVWPAPRAAERPVEMMHQQGYQIASWVQGGMNYSVISDLNEAEVRELAGLLQRS